MNTQQQKLFKILLIGDSCIDEYVYGTCDRLNPEAPVPVLNYIKKVTTKGMAWNVYNNLKVFDVDIHFITNSEEIIKTRFIDQKSNQQILRLDLETNVSPLSEEIPDIEWDGIVISDYNKGFIQKEKIFEITKKYNCPIFIDSKKDELPLENCFIKINNIEAKNLKSKNKNVIVTMGSKGAMYNNTLYPGENVNVYDVVGAGDTFLAAVSYGYIKTKSIDYAIQFANKCSSIAVQHRGTYVLSKEDINYE